MACGCSDKKLHLEDMKNMSIDSIIELYKNGYKIEEEIQEINSEKNIQLSTSLTKTLSPGAHPTIVDSTGCVFDSNNVIIGALAENKASLGYTVGMARFIGGKFTAPSTCNQDFTDRWESCFKTTAWNLKYIVTAWVTGQGIFNYGCLESFACTGGDTCPGSASCGTWSSTHIDYITYIPIHANNSNLPSAPTGLSVTPGNTTLTISWNAVADPTGGDVFAYYIGIFIPGNPIPVVSGYTESSLRSVTIGGLTNGTQYNVQVNGKSHNFIDGASATTTGTPAGPTQPKIFSACWNKPTVTTPCGNNPSLPPIPVNSSFQIAADIYNTGPTGKVRCVFKDGTTTIGTVDNNSLQQCSGSQCTQTAYQWYPTVTYTMPNRDVTLNISTYGWDGTNWTSSPVDSQTLTISSSPICTGITITPFSGNYTAGDHVNFSSTVTPSYPTLQEFQVVFTLCSDSNCTSGTTLTTVTTVNKVANYSWDTTGKSQGTYYIRASVVNQCSSTVSAINVSVPIPTYTVDIYAKDINTNAAISGATVTIGTLPSKTTDTNGHVQFTAVQQGTINITITSTNYNTFTTSESVYSNTTKTYLLSPVSTGPGSLNFIVVAPGASDQSADVYFDSTKQGTTNPTSGVLLISGLTNGLVVNYTVKKSGYNDTTGTVTVVGGTTTDVPVSLTVSSPTTGNACIKSNPAGAAIKVDGTLQTGKITAFSGGGCVSQNIVTGLDPAITHTYELILSGYQNKTGSIAVSAGSTVIINAGDLTKAVVVTAAGFGAVGMIIIGGLAIGAIYAASRGGQPKPKEIKKEIRPELQQM